MDLTKNKDFIRKRLGESKLDELKFEDEEELMIFLKSKVSDKIFEKLAYEKGYLTLKKSSISLIESEPEDFFLDEPLIVDDEELIDSIHKATNYDKKIIDEILKAEYDYLVELGVYFFEEDEF